MEKVQKKQKENLGIEKLQASLEHLSAETKRIPRSLVLKILSQLNHEIPYASQVISPSLGENLLADTPQMSTNLELNDIVMNLAKTLFNPPQKEALVSIVQAYQENRIKTQNEYTFSLLDNVLSESNLQVFPLEVQPYLKDLAHSILGTIISEKLLRRVPGYRLRPLIEIIESFLYKKSLNIEMEKIKNTRTREFRKFINAIAQNGYEQVNDDKMLIAIRKENELAYQRFKQEITSKVPTFAQLKKFTEVLHFLQKDHLEKFQNLGKFLNTLFQTMKKISNYKFLSQHLHIRLSEKLRMTFRTVNQDSHIYDDEQTIKTVHEDVLNEIKDDANALVILILTITSISENFNKKMLHRFSNKGNLLLINEAMTTEILGKNIIKIDPLTAKSHAVRIGGYPQKNIIEVYNQVISQLEAIQEKISGVFANNLKEEITRTIAILNTTRQDLRIVTRAPIIRYQEEPVTFTKEQSEAQLKALVEAEMNKDSMAIDSIPSTQSPASVSILDEHFDLEPEPLKPQPTQEKIEPKPLVIDENVEPEIQTSEPSQAQATITPKPLIIDENFDEETQAISAPASEEKIEPKPLLIDEQFDDEPLILETVTPKTPEVAELDPATQQLMATGKGIMNNYQLGLFEEPILQAWKLMAIPSPSQIQSGMALLPSDNEVRLYVICDLAQQISAIDETTLSPEQKETFNSLVSQIIEALKNPLDEANWDYFEGSHRDLIDGMLMSISQ